MSLLIRMVLVMFVTIGAAQLISGALIYSDSRNQSFTFGVAEESPKLADIIQLLKAVDPVDRRAALERLADTNEKNWIVAQPEPSGQGQVPVGRVSGISEGRSSPLEQVKVAPVQGTVKPDITLLSPKGPGKLSNKPPSVCDVQLQLTDGTKYVVRTITPITKPLPPWYVHALILLIILVCGALFVARAVTQPLSRLVQAADSLGQGLKHPPLPEKGPPELRRAAHAFNTMQDRLRRYLDGRTRILAAMSHDLKTPITRLRLRAEAVTDPQIHAKFVADLDDMQRMVQSSLDMLQGIESDEQFQLVDLNALVATLAEDFAELGFPVEVTGRAHAPLSVRAQGLRRALVNLLQNAQQHASFVSLNVEDTGAEVIFSLRDNGPGLPEEELERVFEPFYRMESSRNRETGGTGLGLSIARDIVQSHGGELTLTNACSGGLEATLRLPR
jgi:signal transduction histidine kinase